MSVSWKRAAALAAVAVLILIGRTGIAAQPASSVQSSRPLDNGPMHLTAFAVNMNATRPGAAATTVDIVVDRFSTDSERDRLREAFKAREQDGLLEALQKLPAVGYLTTPGSLRYDVHFARQRPLPEGGRRIFLLTDRRITAWEAMAGARTLDYPFTLIQLQLDRNDTGVGKMNIAAKITGSEDTVVEIEDFAAQPVQLNNVHPFKS
jgi:hypothetical protein